MQNAGEEGSIVVNKVREGKGNFGYNAATDQYGDLLEQGVIDPVKVVRSALQNAASVAGLMLTTEALVAEKPKEDKAPAAARRPRPPRVLSVPSQKVVEYNERSRLHPERLLSFGLQGLWFVRGPK